MYRSVLPELLPGLARLAFPFVRRFARFRGLFFLLLAPACILPAAAQQAVVTPEEQARLDSLLFEGDFDAVAVFFEAADARPAGTGGAAYAALKQAYLDVPRQIEALTGQGPEVVRTQLDAWRGLRSQFEAARADRWVLQAYEHFERLAVRERTRNEAVRWFYVAHFLRRRYYEQLVDRVRADYGRADAHYRQGAYAAALAVIEGAEPLPRNLPRTHSLADSLVMLRGRVTRAMATLARDSLYWARTEVFRYRFGLAVGGQVLSQAAVDLAQLAYVEADSAVAQVAGLGPWGAKVAPGFTAEVFAQPGERLSVGLAYGYGRFTYQSTNGRDPVLYRFDVAHQSVQLFAHYVLRTTVGLRPYARFGGGWQRTTRASAEGALLRPVEGGSGREAPLTSRVRLPGRTDDGVRAHAAFGVEAMDVLPGRAFVGGEVRYSYNTLHDALVPAGSLSLGLRVGAVF